MLRLGWSASRSRRSSRTSRNASAARKPSRPSSASSSPGQSTPAPSAAQKVPKVVSSRPTANLIVFSGTRARAARARAPRRPRRRTSAAPAAGRGEPETPLRAPERDHDEGDLEALEQHALERDREPVPVHPERARLFAAAAASLALRAKDLLLVVQRLVAARAQDRLPQPLQPEAEQERADDEPERVDGQVLQAPGRARR